MQYKHCKTPYIKKGWYKTTQKYFCKACKKFQRAFYQYQFLVPARDYQIALLNNEAMSISSISQILLIPKITVRRRLLSFSKTITTPTNTETDQVYEVDEMQTFIGSKHQSNRVYITYAIDRDIRKGIDFIIRKRSRGVIGKVISKLILLNPLRIYTVA